MAERMMLVCDTCGRPAAETVTFKTSRGNRQRDYCTQHLDELLGSSRASEARTQTGNDESKRGPDQDEEEVDREAHREEAGSDPEAASLQALILLRRLGGSRSSSAGTHQN